MPFACGFSCSFWKSSSVIVSVQSAVPGPWPATQLGPLSETSMYHSPAPVMFIWYFAPIAFASSLFFSRAAGSSSLNSFFVSTAIVDSLVDLLCTKHPLGRVPSRGAP